MIAASFSSEAHYDQAPVESGISGDIMVQFSDFVKRIGGTPAENKFDGTNFDYEIKLMLMAPVWTPL